jgi:hypothetical protein
MRDSATGICRLAILAILVAVVSLSPRAFAAERVQYITFENLKFSLKSGERIERSMLGAKIEALHGKPVKVRGFIPGETAYTPKLTSFVLLRHNGECCYGPGSQVCDSIQVDMDPGVSAKYTVGSISVEGILSIKEYKDPDGVVRSVYHLRASKWSK